MLNRLLDAVSGLHGVVLVAAIAAMAFGETTIMLDLLVPGEAGMVIGGAAGRDAGLALPLLIAAGAVGATLGDLTSYWIGRRFGVRVLERWRLTRRLVPKAERAHGWFERHGGRAVFFGRWVGALRAVIPLVAGTARMPFRHFVLWDVAASVSWAAAAVSLGWFAGQHIADAVDAVGGWLSLAVIAAAATYAVVRSRTRRQRTPV